MRNQGKALTRVQIPAGAFFINIFFYKPFKQTAISRSVITRISLREALRLPHAFWIDARSPKEYGEDHIRDAINLPLLNDEERHEIGIIYKQISRDKAIEKGMGYYAQKIPTIHAAVKDHRDKNIILYCARGGMRSGIIASLLDSISFNVYQLIDGYKSFRQYMVQELYSFTLKPKIVVLWGLTCTGKTAILQKLENSLDLEGLAQHRGSLMGALGLKPHSQKRFENLLLHRLRELQDQEYIIVEGESRRIGNVMIPSCIYRAMMQGIHLRVTRSLEKRAQAMADEYFKPEHLPQIKEIVRSFTRVISTKSKERIIELIDEGDLSAASAAILQEYYDPLYDHTLKNIEYLFEINADHVEEAVRELRSKLTAQHLHRASG